MQITLPTTEGQNTVPHDHENTNGVKNLNSSAKKKLAICINRNPISLPVITFDQAIPRFFFGNSRSKATIFAKKKHSLACNCSRIDHNASLFGTMHDVIWGAST